MSGFLFMVAARIHGVLPSGMALLLMLSTSPGYAGDLGNQFSAAKLKYGVTLSVPSKWRILNGSHRDSLETAVGAAADLSGYSKYVEGTEVLLFAGNPDPDMYASVTVTVTSMPGVTSSFAESLTTEQVKGGELTVRKAVEATQKQLGTNVWGWTPLTKIELNRKQVMHTSYQRSTDYGDRKVQMFKFFGTGRMVDVVLTTSTAMEDVNSVVLKRIATSIVVP